MKTQNESFIVGVGNYLTKLSQKYMPDPTIFAIVLSVLAYLITLFLTNNSAVELMNFWYQGFWELLQFTMQMSLIIITAGAIANTPIVKKYTYKLASIPKNGKDAAMFITFVAVLLSYIHFGLTMVISATLAKEIGRKFYNEKKNFSYNLFAAVSYTGMAVWGIGLSSSVGLIIATDGHFLQDQIGIIPFNQFLLSPVNITIGTLSIILLPLFARILHPNDNVEIELPEYVIEIFEKDNKLEEELNTGREKIKNNSFGEKLNNSKIIGIGTGIIGLLYMIYVFIQIGFEAFNLNSLNAIFLFIGLALQGTIAKYVKAFTNSTSNASGIIFQFPFYGGIMGIIQYSGMVNLIAEGLVTISTPLTFFVIMLFVASLINMFVPSGGGQWAVQGPIAVKAAQLMNVDVLFASQVVAYGNSLTNLAQPFWALSILGITGVKAKDIMGYSTTMMMVVALIMFGTVFAFSI